jgi:hypothetical protein
MAYLRSGFGDYGRVPSVEWMFYPPPYTFADPAKLTPPAGFHAPPAMMGLGCGSGCTSCVSCRGAAGLGLFDSADWTAWGLGEWATIGLGLYVGMSILGDVGRGARKVKKTFRRRSYRGAVEA